MFKLGVDFDELKETSWGVIILFVVLLAIFTGLLVLVVLVSDTLCPLRWTTCGLTQPAVFVNIVILIILVGGLLGLMGGLRPRDVGLELAKLPEGLVFTIVLWAMSQIIGSALQWVNSGTVVIDLWWATCGPKSILGVLLPRFVGCTLKEEIAFRGFLLGQLFLKFRDRRLGGHLAMLLALGVSQSIFALMHIPCQACNGVQWVDMPLTLLGLVGSGLLLSLIYLRTANLFIAVGVHALICLPTSLFMSPASGSWVIYMLGILLVLVWPLLEPKSHRDAGFSPGVRRDAPLIHGA